MEDARCGGTRFAYSPYVLAGSHRWKLGFETARLSDCALQPFSAHAHRRCPRGQGRAKRAPLCPPYACFITFGRPIVSPHYPKKADSRSIGKRHARVRVGYARTDAVGLIVAIPALLEMAEIEGAIITIDAMGCQRDIAEKILKKEADYVLALKGIKAYCARMSRFSPPNRRPTASTIARSAPAGGVSRHSTVLALIPPPGWGLSSSSRTDM
jgi:hypothetical protein